MREENYMMIYFSFLGQYDNEIICCLCVICTFVIVFVGFKMIIPLQPSSS